jgi:ABC-type Mn2+/Zn2+ transport system permease subunit
MFHAELIYSVVLALLFAVAAGLVGSFALMKRMLLAGDVISHLALPGLGLAFMLGWNPLLGGACSLFAGTVLIAELQKKTKLTTDAMIGVVFAGSLAIGAALTPEADLIDALFGKFQQLSALTFAAGLIAIVVIILFVFRFREQLVLSVFSPELAAATGVRVNRLNLCFLLVFSLVVLVGLRFMGALLAGALIMVPSATGRRLANDLSGFLLASSVTSVIAVALGFILSGYVFKSVGLGPATTIVAAALFGASLLRKPTVT